MNPLRRKALESVHGNRFLSVRDSSNGVRDYSNITSDFGKFCLIDLQLSARTVRGHHVAEIRRFLNSIKKDPYLITDSDIRDYLIHFKEEPWTYKNIVSALRRFFRDYLRRPEVVSSFRLPSVNYEPKRIPTNEELMKFYKYLPNLKQKTVFLMLASSGLRIGELQSLTKEDVDLERRTIIPRNHRGNTKRSWISFFNQEACKVLKEYQTSRKENDGRLITFNLCNIQLAFIKASKRSGVKLTPQTLREWFCQTMGEKGIPDRFIDAFCGRTPKSVLARHYSDYSIQRMKKIYEKAKLKVLDT